MVDEVTRKCVQIIKEAGINEVSLYIAYFKTFTFRVMWYTFKLHAFHKHAFFVFSSPLLYFVKW